MRVWHFIILHQALHPIMFLLNLVYVKTSDSTVVFTSHYVPIKSDARNELKQKLDNFTSHYVPIKSRALLDTPAEDTALHPIMFLLNRFETPARFCFKLLYIPLCSY